MAKETTSRRSSPELHELEDFPLGAGSIDVEREGLLQDDRLAAKEAEGDSGSRQSIEDADSDDGDYRPRKSTESTGERDLGMDEMVARVRCNRETVGDIMLIYRI